MSKLLQLEKCLKNMNINNSIEGSNKLYEPEYTLYTKDLN
jgi:hypothetical protein